jgi:hypothetical protein
MKANRTDASAAWFRRPTLERSEPLRHAGTLYRSAEGPAGAALGGVPLASAEDAVVAAVRMGYRVAQAHVDRAGRLAERLSSAGERAAGPEPHRQAADATEQLVIKSLLVAVQWLESAAAEPGSPLRRYANAQYKLLGALLGLQPGGVPAPPQPQPPAAAAPNAEAPRAGRAAVRVVLLSETSRAVQAHRLCLHKADVEGHFKLTFHCAAEPGSTLSATLQLDGPQAAELCIDPDAASPAGLWTAAVRAPDGEQLGRIEIEL